MTGSRQVKDAQDFAALVENWCRLDGGLRECLGLVDRVSALGGLSNIVLEVEASRGRFVLRLPRPDAPQLVDRHVELCNILSAASAGLAVAPVHYDAANGLLLFPYLSSSDGPPDTEKLGQLLRRLHDTQVLFQNERRLGMWLDGLFEQARLSPSVQDDILQAETLYSELLSFQFWQDSPVVSSHWDVTAANCLSTDAGLLLIDWEFSARGPRAWDLAYAMLEIGFDADEEEKLLAGYGLDGEDLILIRTEVAEMKVACDLVSALWALGQDASGSGATDFRLFARTRIARAQRQLAALILPKM
ncbi:phosphotransferase [Roseibium sediminis]|uniref:phosphotransferase n=1 Tax=Roseibium sediminis TaxID=1775174 RepID=UPI0013764A5D|nr:phosphotransferase [Roseibium sediminis]